ncbi:MAG: glycosyltransferase family 2 protein [Burkholderiaceae bacterium]
MEKATIVLPAFNEEADLPGLLERIDSSLRDWCDYRILVVDDGSGDQTAKIARHAADSIPVTLIQHSHNQGLGAAIRTGLKAAAAMEGVVVTMDADNSQGPELIREMLVKIRSGFDVVIASRFQPGSQEVGVPAYRVALSHLASTLIRTLVRYPGARDFTCGFRAYRLATLRELVSKYGDNFLRENGFSCMYELLLNCRRIDASVAEIPLILRYDLKLGASKMRVIRTALRYMATTIRGFMPLHKMEEPRSARELRNRALAPLLNSIDHRQGSH